MRHTDRKFERELRLLRDRLLLMAGRVEEMVTNSIRSLVERDSELALRTIKDDEVINQDEMAIDKYCLQIIATRQPMAVDLRFLALVLKAVADLERIGDLAENICRHAIELNKFPQVKPYEDIPRMADNVRSMIRDTIDAFVNSDAVHAREVIARDDEMDELYHSIMREHLVMMVENREIVEPGLHIQSIAKHLERMADHCTNFCEHIVFLVEARDIRHTEPNETD